MAVLWPINALAPQAISANISPRTLAGPSSISGFTQVVSSDAGIWRMTYREIPVYNRRLVNLWRALSAIAEGRLNEFIVPLPTPFVYQPVEGDSAPISVPHSDGAFFSDGTGYITSNSNVTVAANLAIRSTSAIFNVIALSDDLEPGQHFSINGRLYRIKTVQPVNTDQVSVTFTPPLREPAVIGDWVEIDNPICVMRLMTDNEMDESLDIGRYGFHTVNFIEAL